MSISTFKEGDRVKVEVEGTVVQAIGDLVGVRFDGSTHSNSVNRGILTKVASAKIDWPEGTVLRHRSSKSMYIRVEGGWNGFYGSGRSSGFYPEGDWAVYPLYDHAVIGGNYDVLNDPGKVWSA